MNYTDAFLFQKPDMANVNGMDSEKVKDTILGSFLFLGLWFLGLVRLNCSAQCPGPCLERSRTQSES